MKVSYILILAGLVLILFGILFQLGVKFGNLPGDIHFETGNFHFYFPITTAIIFSLVFSLFLIFFRLFESWL